MKATWHQRTALLATILTMLLAGAATAQTTLYSDSFSGGAVPLNGVLVEGGSLQTGGVIWSANSAFLANGSINGANEGSAILPFAPQINATYTLSMDVSNTTDRWVGLGFKSNALANPGASDLNDRFSNNNGGVSWMLYRDHATDPTQDIQIFGGLGTGNGIADNDTTINHAVPNTLQIVLDTTGDGSSFTADFFLNGSSISSGPQTVPLGISNIQYVGLTFDNATATPISYDNFLLTELITGPTLNEWNVDADGAFGVAGNWTMGAPAANSDVLFGTIITENRTITLNNSVQLNQISFNNAGDGDYFIAPAASQTVTLTGDAAVSVTGRHWLRAGVAGSQGLNVSGAGELVLDAANTFSGPLNIAAANVAIVNNQALPAGNAVNLTGGARLQVWGPDNGFFTDNGSAGYSSGTIGNAINLADTSALTINDGVDATITGAISGTGTVAVNNADVTFAASNSFSGATTISGGTVDFSGAGSITASTAYNLGNGAAVLKIASSGRLNGAAPINFTSDGGAVGSEAQLELSGNVALSNPVTIAQRTSDVPAIRSVSGNNTLSGGISVGTGGASARVQSDSGLLTISGGITSTAANRNFYLQGAGNGVVSGTISDDGTNTLNLFKAGAGTWTLTAAANTHSGNTTIEQGELILKADTPGGTESELLSPVITVQNGGTFDVTDFSMYALEVGQSLAGGGTIQAQSFEIYDDNTVTPGDSVGTLRIEGNAALLGGDGGGNLNFELGNTVAVGGTENDLIQVTGSFTGASTSMNVNVTPVEGSLAAGTYRLISAGSGAAINTSGLTPRVVSNTGAVLTPRQTLMVGSATGQVNLTVSGSAAALTWNAGGASGDWNTTTANWTGGASTYRDLDNVTFGPGGAKQVVLATEVAPGSTTFNPGAATYEFSGTGGITGYGAVAVNSGTVKLLNEGNNYRGATTIASGARLEFAAAQTGTITSTGGTVAVKNTLVQTLVDDFSGNLSAYNSTVILDVNGGASNAFQWQITDGTLEHATTTYDDIEQAALTRTDFSLAVGEELRVDYSPDNDGSQDIGLYVGAGTPTAGVRQDYVTVYIRNNGGQVLSRGFDGTTEFPLVADGNPPNLDGLFIRRLSQDTFETGYYEAGTRNVLTTRTITNGNAAGIGNSIGFYSDVRGTGVRGNVDNLTIGQGSASNVLAIDGDLALTGGAVEFDVSSAGFTSIDVAGDATLSGTTVAINLIDSFSPIEGADYAVLTVAGAYSASSLNFSLPALTAGLTWDTSTFAIDGILSVIAAGTAGDFNGDGNVDGTDFLLWQRDPGVGALADWQANYGTVAAAPAAGNVPEPAAATLLALALTGWAATAVRRRSR